MRYYIRLDGGGKVERLIEASNDATTDNPKGLIEINRSTYQVFEMLERLGEIEFAQAYKNALFVLHGGEK